MPNAVQLNKRWDQLDAHKQWTYTPIVANAKAKEIFASVANNYLLFMTLKSIYCVTQTACVPICFFAQRCTEFFAALRVSKHQRTMQYWFCNLFHFRWQMKWNCNLLLHEIFRGLCFVRDSLAKSKVTARCIAACLENSRSDCTIAQNMWIWLTFELSAFLLLRDECKAFGTKQKRPNARIGSTIVLSARMHGWKCHLQQPHTCQVRWFWQINDGMTFQNQNNNWRLCFRRVVIGDNTTYHLSSLHLSKRWLIVFNGQNNCSWSGLWHVVACSQLFTCDKYVNHSHTK